MKYKFPRLAEVQLEGAAGNVLSSTGSEAGAVFTVRLPNGAQICVPAGFDADELLTLLVVVRESLE